MGSNKGVFYINHLFNYTVNLIIDQKETAGAETRGKNQCAILGNIENPHRDLPNQISRRIPFLTHTVYLIGDPEEATDVETAKTRIRYF